MAGQKQKEFSYLAIVPRGLQNVISSGLHEQAKALVASGGSDSSSSDGMKKIESEDDVLKVFTWDEKEEEETVREALRGLSIHKKEKEERKKAKESKNIPKHQLKGPYLDEWLPPQCSIGSLKLSSSQQHVSIGYYQTDEYRDGNDDDKTKGDGSFVPCITCTGQFTGSAWMQLETGRKDISQRVISSSRMLGPLVALISVQTDNHCLEASTTTDENTSPHDLYQRYHRHPLKEMIKEVTRHIESNSSVFMERIDRALRVWRDCVYTSWKDRLSPYEYEGLQNRIRENRLRFRISCVRAEPPTAPSTVSRKRKKKFNSNRELFAYSRQEFCLAMMEACGRKLVPGYYGESQDNTYAKEPAQNEEQRKGSKALDGSNTSGKGSGTWSVDLEKFDIELVIFITPPDLRSKNGKLAFGVSLCPYSFAPSRSFSQGNIPPDITVPYLGGDILSKGIIRLRPTTANLLLQIANLQKYDVVLDPCAGIGTIPVEAEQYHKRFEFTQGQSLDKCKHFISIGGDLILNNSNYTEVSGMMEGFIRRKNNDESCKDRLTSSSLLVAWDAAHLPMRTGSVDAVVSDLPFGQQCLSASAVSQLLPLVFLECARVLTLGTGRMVVLAGGSPTTLISLIRELSGKYWKKPISRVSPVTIGGILAWIVRVDRNYEVFDCSCVSEQIDRVRKVTQKRDRTHRQRKSDSGQQITGAKRRTRIK